MKKIGYNKFQLFLFGTDFVIYSSTRRSKVKVMQRYVGVCDRGRPADKAHP